MRLTCSAGGNDGAVRLAYLVRFTQASRNEIDGTVETWSGFKQVHMESVPSSTW